MSAVATLPNWPFGDLQHHHYRVILVDPPWEYETWSERGQGKSAQRHYKTMPLDEIKALPIGDLARKDCALFSWNIWPFMPHWDAVLQAWGFSYAGLAWEWIKFNPITGKYAFGGGYGTRKNLEPCLLATRGAPQVRKAAVGTLFDDMEQAPGARSVRDFIQAMPLDCIRAPLREHSRKPDEQYDRIETLFAGPYAEVFARQRRPGWHSCGDQLGKFEAGP